MHSSLHCRPFAALLKKLDVPTLIVHGDDDQIAPIGAAALAAVKLIKNAILMVYPGTPHGRLTRQGPAQPDLLAFLKAQGRCAGGHSGATGNRRVSVE